MTVPVSALQGIAPGAIIELFELQLNVTQHGVSETYRFHAGTNEINDGDVIWAGNAYQRFPIEVEGFQYNGQGQLPRPTLRISNLFGTITAILLTLPSGLEGAKVTRIRTLARYLDAANFTAGNPNADPTSEFPREIYYIDRKAAENRDVIEFELAAAFDLAGVRAPKRQCVGNICQWVYKGSECGYAGNAYYDANDVPVTSIGSDVCGKRLSSCELRFAQIKRQGSVTTGSPTFTLTEATALSTGNTVTGFGIAPGTTVSSYSGLNITLSANATATTTLTKTGTLQTNLDQIIVTNATGLSVGMTVTGNYLAADTQVTAIAGTTVTLSSKADRVQFLTLSASFNSIAASNLVDKLKKTTTAASDLIYASTSGFPSVSVGQYIASTTLISGGKQLMPLASLATITSLGKFGNTTKTIAISVKAAVSLNTVAAWKVYTTSSPTSATYTFTATNKTYTFRADNAIPYGSFPGVGTFGA